MKGGDHSAQKGGHLLIRSAHSYFNVDNVQETEGVIVSVDIPSEFDFEKRGKELLNRIQSACRLFSEESDE